MIKSILVSIWNMLVMFISITVIIISVLTFLTLGIEAFPAMCIGATIVIILLTLFMLECKKKTDMSTVSRKKVKGAATLAMSVVVTVTFCSWLEGHTVIVCNHIGDVVLQCIPFGIGQLFTAMAYSSVFKTTESFQVLQDFRIDFWCYLLQAVSLVIASTLITLDRAFILKGDE